MYKRFLLITALMLFAALPAQAQQPKKVPRIGYVSTIGDPYNPGYAVEAFRQGLRDISYIEGKSIVVEYRYIEGKIDRTPDLVAELVQLKVDVLVVTGLTPVRAAKQATNTIPIVMVTTQDPVATGLVDSFARPGGNITGTARVTRELGGKRLELFKEVVPKMSRVAILWNADESGQLLL
jgi:putative tryptophan/tyrosine transport system substrate-binding protein